MTINVEVYEGNVLVSTVETSAPRGYSAYEIAVQQGYVGTEAEWNAAVNAARLASEQAAISAEEDAQQTALDRIATGQDRIAAAQSASDASSFAISASNSASITTTQAGIATTKASEASDSASTATQQAGIATDAANTATQARDTVLGVKAEIDARFLPDATTDPSTTGLVGGELYYNTALNAYRYFNGTVFDYLTPDGDYLLL